MAEGDRVCLNTDGAEDCGNCLNGCVEYKDECLLIDDIDETRVVEMIEEFNPQFTSNATTEERLELLEIVVREISFLLSRIPPVPFDLDINKFSFDTEEEMQQRQGYHYQEGAEDDFPQFDFSRRKLQDLPEAVDLPAEGAM